MTTAVIGAQTISSTDARPPHSSRRGKAPPQSWAFRALLFLIFVIYIGPQNLVPALEPLHLALVSAALAIVGSGRTLLSQGRRLLVLNAEVRLLGWLLAAAILSIPFSKCPKIGK